MKKWGITYHAEVVAYTEVEAETEDDARELFESYQDGHDLFNDQCDGSVDIIDEIEYLEDIEREEPEDTELKNYEIRFYFDKVYNVDVETTPDCDINYLFNEGEYRTKCAEENLVYSSENVITSIRQVTPDDGSFQKRFKEAAVPEEEKLHNWGKSGSSEVHLYNVTYYYRVYCIMDLQATSAEQARKIFKEQHSHDVEWEYDCSTNIFHEIRYTVKEAENE